MTELAVIDKKQDLAASIEKALVFGDLSKLDAVGRMTYYRDVCTSLGLNPLTRPFEYITLNGKLTLYAKRDCAEQLRKIHGVSVTSMKNELIGEIYVVTVSGKDKTGREDYATGAVPTANLKGENLANAYLKAETKAKRRLTLSICGLGLLDETEVESIPTAHPFTENAPEGKETTVETVSSQGAGQEGPFSVIGSRVTCVPVSVTPGKSKKNRIYLQVILNGDIEHEGISLSTGFVWDEKLFPAVRSSLNQETVFEWKIENGFLKLLDIVKINDVDYQNGEPIAKEPEHDESAPF